MNEETSSGSSLTDILLGHARTEEEVRAIFGVLRHWANTDPQSFPAQLAVVTLTQWYAAASIPVQVGQMLEEYRLLLQTGCETVDASIATRLEELASMQASFEESVAKMRSHIVHLYKVADGAERHLNELIRAAETLQVESRQRLEEELSRRANRLVIWAIVGGFILAAAFHTLDNWWVHRTTSPESSVETTSQGTVQSP